MSENERLKAIVWLLEQEIEALRSVLSEWDCDKMEYLQMHKAEAIRELFNHIAR